MTMSFLILLIKWFMIFSEKYKICSSCNETAPIIQCICKVCISELVKKKTVLIESFVGEKIDPLIILKKYLCQILLKLQLENQISKILVALKQYLK